MTVEFGFRTFEHGYASQRRNFRQVLITVKASNFFDQVFFNLDVKAIARSIHNECVSFFLEREA